MNRYGIIHFSTEGSDVKASVAEVFIREIKRIIYKMITWRKGNQRYIDDLSKIVAAYNQRIHPRTGYRPDDVDEYNAPKVFAKLFPEVAEGKKGGAVDKIPSFRYKVGDKVRIALSFSKLRHGYLPHYSDEIYIVSKVLKHRRPVKYTLETWEDKEEVVGSFAAHEMIKVIFNGSEKD